MNWQPPQPLVLAFQLFLRSTERLTASPASRWQCEWAKTALRKHWMWSSGCQVIPPDRQWHDSDALHRSRMEASHLVSRAELVDGEDLSRVECLAEYVNGSQLTAKHSVGVRCLWWTQETLVVALRRGRTHRVFLELYCAGGQSGNTLQHDSLQTSTSNNRVRGFKTRHFGYEFGCFQQRSHFLVYTKAVQNYSGTFVLQSTWKHGYLSKVGSCVVMAVTVNFGGTC